jgi:hypothetical protein
MALVDRFEVTRLIKAPASEIFTLLCDPTGHVAIDSSGSLMAAMGDSVTGVGDTFVVHMDREALNDYDLGLYDMTVTITAFEQDRLLEWQPSQSWAHLYGYRLNPTDAGTEVTSYCDWSAVDQEWKDAGVFPVIPEATLRASLAILDRTLVPRG